jgi:hypothetical protein
VAIGFARAAALTVRLSTDVPGQGQRDLAGRAVTVSGGPAGHEVAVTATTDTGGVAEFDDPAGDVLGLRPGRYTIAAARPAGWSCGSASAQSIAVGGRDVANVELACDGEAVAVDVTGGMGMRVRIADVATAGEVVASAWNDLNADGVRQELRLGVAGATAVLLTADGTTVVATAITDAAGEARFGGVAPGAYVVEMRAPAAARRWIASTLRTAPVTVAAGGEAAARVGFVQPGTVGANVWDDGDRDGEWDADERPAGAGRTVRLLNRAGTRLVAVARTDAAGHVAFDARAGVVYRLRAVPGAGWSATSPVGSVAVRRPDRGSRQPSLGLARSVDTIAPARPAPSATGGILTAWQTVGLSAETGARIRYTTNGSAPSRTAGRPYTGPVPITRSTTLRAVAIDRAGNVSRVATETYFVLLPAPAVGTASSWTVTRGAVAGGDAGALRADDASYLTVASARVAGRNHVDAYASLVLPDGQRDVGALLVEYDGGGSGAAAQRTLSLYDWRAGGWETIDAGAQPAADALTAAMVAGDPNRFVSVTGQVRLRVAANAAGPFSLAADMLRFTYAAR